MNDLRKLAAAVAVHLPNGPWKVRSYDGGFRDLWVSLIRVDGAELYFDKRTGIAKGGKVNIHVGWPHSDGHGRLHPNGKYVDGKWVKPKYSINVSASRGPVAIAKDIIRRLPLDAYLKHYAKKLKLKADYEDYDARKAELVERFKYINEAKVISDDTVRLTLDLSPGTAEQVLGLVESS